MPINVAALLLALYEPVKLAEDLAVVDLISRGRVSYVVGIGYRAEEFAMFGVDRRRRGRAGRGAHHTAPPPVGGRGGRGGRSDGPRDTPPLHARWAAAGLRRRDRGGGPAGGPARAAVLGRDARQHARGGLPVRRRCVGARLLLPGGGGAEHRVRRRRSRTGLGGDRRVPPADSVSYSGWNAHREGTASISRATSVGGHGSRERCVPDPHPVRGTGTRRDGDATRPAATGRRAPAGPGLALPRGGRGGGVARDL